MAGYNGFSMSNNAVSAYNMDEMPLSKWTKTAIIEAIEAATSEGELNLNCTLTNLKKAPAKVLKKLCLYRSSWHHTSSYYNETNFYSLDVDYLEGLTDESLNECIEKSIAEGKANKKEEPTEEKWRCAFLEWGGTRKHPKAWEVVEDGIIKGNWFILSDGSKKKTTANGFRFIEKIQ